MQGPKSRHLGTTAQLCLAISSQLRHVLTIGKKLLNSNISSTCPRNMVNFSLLAAEIISLVCGTPKNFNGFRFVTAATSLSVSQPNFARCLAISWAGTLYIHFPGLLRCNRILPGVKFTLRPSLALSYIARVAAWHSSSGHQPTFVVWYKEWNYGTFAKGTTYIRKAAIRLDIGPHSSLLINWPGFPLISKNEFPDFPVTNKCDIPWPLITKFWQKKQ